MRGSDSCHLFIILNAIRFLQPVLSSEVYWVCFFRLPVPFTENFPTCQWCSLQLELLLRRMFCAPEGSHRLRYFQKLTSVRYWLSWRLRRCHSGDRGDCPDVCGTEWRSDSLTACGSMFPMRLFLQCRFFWWACSLFWHLCIWLPMSGLRGGYDYTCSNLFSFMSE